MLSSACAVFKPETRLSFCTLSSSLTDKHSQHHEVVCCHRTRFGGDARLETGFCCSRVATMPLCEKTFLIWVTRGKRTDRSAVYHPFSDCWARGQSLDSRRGTVRRAPIPVLLGQRCSGSLVHGVSPEYPRRVRDCQSLDSELLSVRHAFRCPLGF
jgi:hypothetical protein